MAENKNMVKKEKSVKNLEEEITCAICHEHYTDPKVLPCCHYYCKQCIDHLLALRTGIDKPFPCPECCKDTTLPEDCVDNLPTAFFINRMKELHSKLELAHDDKVETKCEMCLEGKAKAFCRECNKLICVECIKAHKQLMKLFPGHKIYKLEELGEKEAKGILIKEPSHETCKVHKQPMNMYCYNCNTMICRDCTITDHLSHKYEFVLEAAPKMKEELTQRLGPLIESQESLLHTIQKIQTTIGEVEDQGGSVANTIMVECNELHNIIDDHQEALLEEAAMRVQQKVECLSRQEESLSAAYTGVQSVIRYTKQYIEHSTNDDVMCMHVETRNRIDREIQEQHVQVGLEPVEEADMGIEVNCAKDLKQLCHTKVKLTQLALITGEGARFAEVNKTSEFQIVTKQFNAKLTKIPVVVECHLKSLASNSTTSCIVELIKSDEYRFKYTPTIRGRHEVIVTMNGEEISGSPFPVFVSVHPTQLRKPVQIITGVKYPWHLALTPAGNIIVRDSQKITMLETTGKKMMKSEYSFINPLGVAVDSTDGCVYVTDNPSCNSKIVKLSPDLKLKRVFDSNSDIHYRGVSVVGDEVMICCKNSNIMVYTKELEYVREIGSHGDGPGEFQSIRDMCSDEHGTLYVCDNDSRVQVFSNEGEFLHSFDCVKNGNSQGITVSGSYLYVTNYSCDNVSVFTTDGDHVKTFGQGSGGNYNLKGPCGVYVDKDGYVYVCDNNKDRIQIF